MTPPRAELPERLRRDACADDDNLPPSEPATVQDFVRFALTAEQCRLAERSRARELVQIVEGRK